MAYTKIPEKDAILLIRALGLLVNQAGIYGPTHNVTRSAARSVFAELEQAVKVYGPIEIALKDNRVLINGSIDGLDAAAGKNLKDRMTLHKVGGIVFLAPLDPADFTTCITLFGKPPATLAEEGGFEEALKRANVRSVKVVTVAYQRVGAQPPPEPVPEQIPAETKTPPARRPEPASSGIGVLDLSSAFGVQSDELEKSAPANKNVSAELRKERSQALAALLRDTAALLEQGGALSEEEEHARVMGALTRIRETLGNWASESEHQIAVLADQVDEDRQTVASIESAARRRGIGIKLTRVELVERYAELNQEIVQPLTVSTGVIDMLSSGNGGPLTGTQRDMLKLAAESVERVNQLVAYMRRIAGLPDSFTPDAKIIKESYS